MRMLDLFCGEGLASWGYWLSGRFHEIVGVDVGDMSSSYSFNFLRADAMTLDYEFLMSFDFIHASPPCQAYSKVTPAERRSSHPRLINAVHRMLVAVGVPYVIENVEGSGRELRPNLRLHGYDVGLPSRRVRYFHVSTGKLSNVSSAAGANLSSCGSVHDLTRSGVIAAMGLDCINPNVLGRMTVNGMLQGVPPVMTKYISSWMFPHKFMIGSS